MLFLPLNTKDGADGGFGIVRSNTVFADQLTFFTGERKERIGGSRSKRMIFHKVRSFYSKISAKQVDFVHARNARANAPRGHCRFAEVQRFSNFSLSFSRRIYIVRKVTGEKLPKFCFTHISNPFSNIFNAIVTVRIEKINTKCKRSIQKVLTSTKSRHIMRAERKGRRGGDA